MIEKLAQRAEENAAKQGGYTIRDGIAFCDTCGKPRQKLMPFPGGERLIWISCGCHEQESTAEAERIEKLQEIGRVCPKWTFDRADSAENLEKLRRYAAAWDKVKERGAGLLLWGPVGTGKTFLTHCIANEVIRRDEAVLITSFSSAVNAGFDKREELVRCVRERALVVFDDLGAERSSEYALETVFVLVDERLRSGNPMIVTTNLALSELRNPGDLDRKRIYDRILQRCVPVEFKGQSLREREAAELLEFMRGVLAGT